MTSENLAQCCQFSVGSSAQRASTMPLAPTLFILQVSALFIPPYYSPTDCLDFFPLGAFTVIYQYDLFLWLFKKFNLAC